MEATGLENLTQAFTFITTCMTSMSTVILGNAIFLIPVGIFTAGAAIGLCGRLIGRSLPKKRNCASLLRRSSF